MWKFGIRKRDLEKVVDALKDAVKRVKEELSAERLDNTFATSYTRSDDSGNYSVTTTGGNAVELVSNAQTREDGGTNNNNRITDGTTVNMDFEYDALKAMHRTASLVKDPKGKTMNVDPDTLVFKKGTVNSFRAKEILGAIRGGGKSSIPGSADNDSAGVPAFSVIDLPYIETNTAYWWAFDSAMNKNPAYGLKLKESQPPQLEGPNVVFKTGEIQLTLS